MAHSKIAKRAHSPKSTKEASVAKNPQGYFKLPIQFSFSKYNAGTPWSISDNGKPHVDSVFNNLRGIEGMIWSDVFQAFGGRKKGTNSHEIPVCELSKDAIHLADSIQLNETSLFSLRIQGDVRLWGIIEPDGQFFVIWYDPNHKVYPV